MSQRIKSLLLLFLLLTVFSTPLLSAKETTPKISKVSTATKAPASNKKVGITQSLEFALIKINFTSGPGAPAQGTAEIQNIGTKKKSSNFEITILAKDNKTPLFKLYSSVKDLSPGKRTNIIFKAKREPLPTDRTFIFSFRTLDGTNR